MLLALRADAFARAEAALVDAAGDGAAGIATSALVRDDLSSLCALIDDALRARPDEFPVRLAAIREHAEAQPNLVSCVVASTIDLDYLRAVAVQEELRLTAVGVATLEHRERHGAWPADGAALVPEFLDRLPTDATGRPPRLSRRGNAVLVHFDAAPDSCDAGTDATEWLVRARR